MIIVGEQLVCGTVEGRGRKCDQHRRQGMRERRPRSSTVERLQASHLHSFLVCWSVQQEHDTSVQVGHKFVILSVIF